MQISDLILEGELALADKLILLIKKMSRSDTFRQAKTDPSTKKHRSLKSKYKTDLRLLSNMLRESERKIDWDAQSGTYIRGTAGVWQIKFRKKLSSCLLYTSPSPRDATLSRMPSSA